MWPISGSLGRNWIIGIASELLLKCSLWTGLNAELKVEQSPPSLIIREGPTGINFNHSFTTSDTFLWYRQDQGKSLESLFLLMSNRAVRKKGVNSLLWYQSPWQPPAYHSLPSWPLCHILLCCGRTVSPWCVQSVLKPAAVAPAHTPVSGTAVLRIPSLSLALCLKEDFWVKWEKNGILTLIFFIVEVFLEGRRIVRQAERGTT